jgi:hypothetical protein
MARCGIIFHRERTGKLREDRSVPTTSGYEAGLGTVPESKVQYTIPTIKTKEERTRSENLSWLGAGRELISSDMLRATRWR